VHGDPAKVCTDNFFDTNPEMSLLIGTTQERYHSMEKGQCSIRALLVGSYHVKAHVERNHSAHSIKPLREASIGPRTPPLNSY
jgi:hypothetical protein